MHEKIRRFCPPKWYESIVKFIKKRNGGKKSVYNTRKNYFISFISI